MRYTSEKVYSLLAERMERSGRAGIATFVMRRKDIWWIFSENGLPRAETMRFAHLTIGLPRMKAVAKQFVAKFASRRVYEASLDSKLFPMTFDDICKPGCAVVTTAIAEG